MFGHVMSLKYVLFFFFKQKTAYEMRISDWSSDVCSSDLVLSYDGDRCPRQHAQTRKGPTPGEFPEQVYRRYADNIFLGADFDYDEWGYMQWIWKATHNEDFFGIPAAGKTTYTRGTTPQFYRDGKKSGRREWRERGEKEG